MAAENSTGLRIGDYISLKNVVSNSTLCAEGIFSEDIYVDQNVKVFDDTLFAVHLQRQYSASRELQEFLSTYASNKKGLRDTNAEKYYQALKRGADNETKLNNRYMKDKTGQAVLFGDVIQLCHVKSGKYISVKPSELANDERENTKIVLDRLGSVFSWLQVCPRFKIDRDGDRILTGAEIYLRVVERANEYVHRSDRDPLPGREREVNCSLEVTSWRLNLFQSSVDTVDRNILLASEIVYMRDPETRCDLTISLPKVESFDEEPNEDDPTEESEFFHDNGDTILVPSKEGVVPSNFLWFIESSSMNIGGPINMKLGKVRFKHLNTSRYLRLLTIQREDSDGNTIDDHIFTTTRDPLKEGTLFSLVQLNVASKFLTNARACQIGQNGVWFERGDVLDEGNYAIKGTKDKFTAVNIILYRYVEFVEDESKSAEVEDSVALSDPLDEYVGLSARKYFKRFYDMTVIPKGDSTSTVWPSASRGDMEFFTKLTKKTVFFSQGFSVSEDNIQLGIDKAEASLRIQRQNLLRDQDILEIILRIINKLIPITERYEVVKANANKKKFTVTEAETSLISTGELILNRLFDLVYYSIADNPENQIYVASFMPVLLAHLNSQELAGQCVTEMLSKNMELQETKIGTREIQIFVDKLRSSKMNAMYLNLLRACCSCEGNGVDGNQGKVASMLFSNTNDIIITMSADYKRCIPTTWISGSSNMYLSITPIPGSPLRGESLLTKGLPTLSLAWTTNSIDFSPLGLFGKLSVNVADLFKLETFSQHDDDAAHKQAKGVNSKRKQAAEQKASVANYFVAEMFLAAEMCMDRNYISMHKLDDLFPYETLVTVLKMDVSNNLKSAACRLLMCQHIDRDPQATSKIPCLTRAWSEIEKYAEPQLPFVEPARRYEFGLVQHLLSDHVKKMASRKWDGLSRHMLKLLRTMAEFNFYGSTDRMKDVIGPLIGALDRRNVVGDNESENTPQDKPAVKVDDENGAGGGGGGGTGGGGEGVPAGDVENEGGQAEAETESSQQEQKSRGSPRGLLHRIGELFGLVKASRVTKEEEQGLAEQYTPPKRFSKAPIYELETMVEAVDILAYAQTVIDDRNISIFMRYFYAWDSGADTRSPAELFEQTMIDSKELTLGIADFDNIMIDVLMFVHTPLVQSTLEVLMAHHSKRLTLLNNLEEVQLLASHGRERQFRIVEQMLKQLEQNAETQELWGPLETEADRAVSKQTTDILKELTDICRIRRTELAFDEEYMPDVEIQTLYCNLGCLQICMKVLNLFESIEEDENGEIDAAGENTKEHCRLCNELLFWFFLGHSKNQEEGYEELEFFLDTLDQGINSHIVLPAIFKGNEGLMKRIPHSHLNDLVDKIVKEGKTHQYLTLFPSICYVGEKNIVENQFEIVKILTSPGRFQKLSCFFVPVDHPDYAVKKELMLPFLNARDVSIEDLPPLIAYHVKFIETLSSCTVGRNNLSTVQAKVQSVFNYVDLIDAILDIDALPLVKTKLSQFLYNAFIEVELRIPGLENAASIWKLLESYKITLNTGKDELAMAERLGWQSAQVSRQRIEFMIVCIKIIHSFFSVYYDVSAMRIHDVDAAAKAATGKFHFSSSHVDDLITTLFGEIKTIYELDVTCLSKSTKSLFHKTLEILSKSTSGQTDKVLVVKAARLRELTTSGDAEDESDDLGVVQDFEQELIKKYRDFLQQVAEDKSVRYKAENENVAFISLLERLPFIADPVDADVRYEALIKKLVQHIRENIKLVNNQKQMDPRITTTSRWIVRAFRLMIENRMGMSIYERDDDGGEEQDNAAAPVVNALNSCGATALCLDLIADGIDPTLQMEAVKLGVGLLFKEGGALEVQSIMNHHLRKSGSDLFFKQVRLSIQKLQAWHNWNKIIVLKEGQEPNPPEEVLLLRFLQLMCEGHYLPNQEIMREQPFNSTSFNLLDDFANYLNCLVRLPCRTSSVVAIRLSATILEVLQGPCSGNQSHFTLNTELLETLNRLNRSKVVRDCVEEEEVVLKRTSIDILQALLEGQGAKSVVFEKLLSVLHLDIILYLSKNELKGLETADGEREGGRQNEELREQKVVFQTECVVLLQTLCNFRPSLYDELGISRKVEDIVGSGTAMIEVIWRNDIHRRFFHIPRICDYLAKSSKDSLVANVDRSNAENKLIDFLNRSHDLYREVKHQQLLTELKLSKVFNLTNKDRASWITFSLAFVVNMLMMLTFEYGGDHPIVAGNAKLAIQVLNIVQAVFAGIVLLQNLVVRVPVKYQKLQAANLSRIEIILYTAAEPMTLYYLCYLVFVIFGLVISYAFLPFLLLDIIVKNSTTQDVLNAVIYPRKQIAMGGIIILFIMHIYAFFLFLYFRNDLLDVAQPDRFCSTLFNCYLVTLGYGLREGGGVGDVFRLTLGRRWLLDLSFYCVITVGMLNLIAGVIITTFGQLRENKMIQMADTVGVCFICNIDKQVFDRASTEPEGFKTHVKIDHNMWNYMYYIFLLWEQDKDDDDGMEQYVRRAIAANEIVWFPLNKAIRLNSVSAGDDAFNKDLRKSIEQTESSIHNKLEKFQTNLTVVLEQLNQSLKKDMHPEEGHPEGGGDNKPFRRKNTQRQTPRNGEEALEDGLSDDEASPGLSFFEDVKVLSLQILSVTGLVMLPESPSLAYVEIVFEGETLRAECERIVKAERKLLFADTKHRVGSTKLNGDRRECSITFGWMEEGVESGASRTATVATMTVDDILLTEDAITELFFAVPSQGGQVKLSMKATRSILT